MCLSRLTALSFFRSLSMHISLSVLIPLALFCNMALDRRIVRWILSIQQLFSLFWISAIHFHKLMCQQIFQGKGVNKQIGIFFLCLKSNANCNHFRSVYTSFRVIKWDSISQLIKHIMRTILLELFFFPFISIIVLQCILCF